MKLLIKIPTRSRPAIFLKVLNLYLGMITNPDTKILISIDEDDFTMDDDVIDQFVNDPRIILEVGLSKSKIDAVNRDIDKHIDKFDILMVGSDDMFPQEHGFDQLILNAMKMYYPDGDGALWFNDGRCDVRLNTLPILGKAYYKRFGYVYHPSYVSLWCDNEYTDVAKSLNKIKYIPKVIVKHEHPDWGGVVPVDAQYIAQRGFWGVDEQNYYQRKEKGFA